MPKFKVGDIITPIIPTKIMVDEFKVVRVDNTSYYCKMLCGMAILPIKAENGYKLKENTF
jgi:hypothetical protein